MSVQQKAVWVGGSSDVEDLNKLLAEGYIVENAVDLKDVAVFVVSKYPEITGVYKDAEPEVFDLVPKKEKKTRKPRKKKEVVAEEVKTEEVAEDTVSSEL